MNYLLIIVLLLGVVSCNEEDSSTGSTDSTLNASVSTVNGTESSTASVLGDYDQSSFSKYIYWHKIENKVLIDYNFFPESTDFDSQEKQVSIPCDFMEDTDTGGADVDLNAPTGNVGCEDVELDVSSAVFTIDGLEFSFSESLDIFSTQFGFKLTSSGFTLSETGAVLTVSADVGNLENIYNAVLDAR